MRGIRVRGILLSLMAILVVSGMTGAAYAWPGNNGKCHYDNCYCRCQCKTDLKLKDQDEGWGDGVTATWTATSMAPGDEFAFDGSFVGLRDKSSRNLWGEVVAITCEYKVDEELPQTEADTDPQTDLYPDDMAKQMVITRCIYKNCIWQIDCLTGKMAVEKRYRNTTWRNCINRYWRIQDVDSDGRITFYDLKQRPLTNLPSPRWGGVGGTRFEMSIRFHQDAENEFQGDTFDLTMVYALEMWQPKGEFGKMPDYFCGSARGDAAQIGKNAVR
jgi:hypothetical protein